MIELNSRAKAVGSLSPCHSVLGDTTSRASRRRWPQPRSTQTALFGCSQPSSASGAALSSTVPAGSCTGSVPIATATRKCVVAFADEEVSGLDPPGAAVVRGEDLVLPQLPAQLQGRFGQVQGGLRVLLLEFDRVRAPARGDRAATVRAARCQPSEKPWFSAASSVHGSGTRAPSRQTPPRAHIGSTRASTGTSTSGSPSSWPW